MRLLVVTQSIDTEDPVLGFMHRWVEKFSEHFESIAVVCLRKGKYNLPPNVEVLSLGKEEGRSVVRYIARFYKYLFQKRNQYDAVLVHMNEEYVLLGGLLWKFSGKPTYLWRNHLRGSWKTRLAGMWSEKVFYTSPQSFTAVFKNAYQMPVGIDTEHFAFGTEDRGGVLMLGRLDPIKRVMEMAKTVVDASREQKFNLTVVGSPSKGAEEYAQSVREALKGFLGEITFVSSIPNEEAPHYFQSADIMLNFTPSGSFDKAIFEAASCGTLVLTTNVGLEKDLPEECFTELNDSKEALIRLLQLPADRKAALRSRLRQWVETEHSLSELSKKLQQVLR